MAVSMLALFVRVAEAQVQIDDTPPQPDNDFCFVRTELFPLKKRVLTVFETNGGILFTAGMTIDADGAPNAYGPHNRGLDLTANARGHHRWSSVVTNRRGRPVVQKSGPYRGYYISTTSLQQASIADVRNPKRYIDATTIPYIALPPDFARDHDIHLGDLAVVANPDNGRTAYAIFADIGPRGRIGEGSIALAKELGLPANPRHDSVPDGLIYLIFPGSREVEASHINLLKVSASTDSLYHRWGGMERLQALTLAPPETDFVSATGCADE